MFCLRWFILSHTHTLSLPPTNSLSLVLDILEILHLTFTHLLLFFTSDHAPRIMPEHIAIFYFNVERTRLKFITPFSNFYSFLVCFDDWFRGQCCWCRHSWCRWLCLVFAVVIILRFLLFVVSTLFLWLLVLSWGFFKACMDAFSVPKYCLFL